MCSPLLSRISEPRKKIKMNVRPLLRRCLVTIVGAGALAVGLTGCEKSADEYVPAATYVNTRCPIMDMSIDPATRSPELTAMHMGQNVAFCCGQCLPKWAQLTSAQKVRKLAEAMSGTGSHNHGNESQNESPAPAHEHEAVPEPAAEHEHEPTPEPAAEHEPAPEHEH